MVATAVPAGAVEIELSTRSPAGSASVWTAPVRSSAVPTVPPPVANQTRPCQSGEMPVTASPPGTAWASDSELATYSSQPPAAALRWAIRSSVRLPSTATSRSWSSR